MFKGPFGINSVIVTPREAGSSWCCCTQITALGRSQVEHKSVTLFISVITSTAGEREAGRWQGSSAEPARNRERFVRAGTESPDADRVRGTAPESRRCSPVCSKVGILSVTLRGLSWFVPPWNPNSRTSLTPKLPPWGRRAAACDPQPTIRQDSRILLEKWAGAVCVQCKA